MIEKDLFDDQYEKLLGICDKNNLVADFSAAQYPIMLTVRPDTSMEGQISMLEDDVGHNNRDSRIDVYKRQQYSFLLLVYCNRRKKESKILYNFINKIIIN